MDNSFLTASGQKELQVFLNFFNLKKQSTIKEINLDFQEFAEVQVNDTLYNKDDIVELISKLSKSITQSIEKDLSKMIHMCAVYVKIFLYEAQQNNIDFHADFNFIENLKIIEEMKVLEKGGSVVIGEEQALGGKQKVVYSRLPTIDKSQQGQIDEYQNEIERLRQLTFKLQNELVQQKKSSVGEQATIDTLHQLHAQIVSLKNENQELQAESQKRINDTTQFKNLKTMLQQKNDRVKELSDRLSKYEKIDE